MDGADAVIHLAWIIQPNHDRERLRRTNVVGTARMLAAARRAGCRTWWLRHRSAPIRRPTTTFLATSGGPPRGISSCEYSVDKADVEQLLNDHEIAHPEILITRLRPALIFQRDVGSEIIRYFVGRGVPPRVFDGKLPVLPWPHGMRLQAVHADDVAQAYLLADARASRRRVQYRCRRCARRRTDCRTARGRPVFTVPTAAVRAAVSAAWNTRVRSREPGWIDMAASAPVMSTGRAQNRTWMEAGALGP